MCLRDLKTGPLVPPKNRLIITITTTTTLMITIIIIIIIIIIIACIVLEHFWRQRCLFYFKFQLESNSCTEIFQWNSSLTCTCKPPRVTLYYVAQFYHYFKFYFCLFHTQHDTIPGEKTRKTWHGKTITLYHNTYFPSLFSTYVCSHVYVVVHFYPWFKFYFLLF